jgi:hypothetical protein
MSEKSYHQEILTREWALAKAHAAEEVGGVAVKILANEGEPYTHDPVSRFSGGGLMGDLARPYRGRVPEGHVYVRVKSDKGLVEHARITKQKMEELRDAA